MAHEAQQTTDHDVIREWIEARDGHPAVVRASQQGDSGILRVDYPGYSGQEALERISWDRFFSIFEDNELAFLYQDTTEDGATSRFSKFVSRQ